MGLFTKKKKDIPQFPKLPERPSFPEYRSQVPTPEPFRIPLPPQEEFNIPIRRPEMPRPRPMPIQEISQEIPLGTQPIFVKIEKYKAAIKALNEIKQRLEEAEDTLTKISVIKVRESDEIARWESEIQNMKDKLIAIDKNLFEV